MVGFRHSRPQPSGEINSLCPKGNSLVLNLPIDDACLLPSPSTSLEWLNDVRIILLPPNRATAALSGVEHLAVWFYMRAGF